MGRVGRRRGGGGFEPTIHHTEDDSRVASRHRLGSRGLLAGCHVHYWKARRTELKIQIYNGAGWKGLGQRTRGFGLRISSAPKQLLYHAFQRISLVFFLASSPSLPAVNSIPACLRTYWASSAFTNRFLIKGH